MDWFEYKLRTMSASKIIVFFSVGLFALYRLVGFGIGSGQALVDLGADSSRLIFEGQVWRLLTYAFLHVNEIHLLFNMYALWYLGQFVEKFFDRRKFVVTFVFTAIGAGIVSTLWQAMEIARTGTNVTLISVGASGAIFGLLGLILGKTIISQRYGMSLPVNNGQLITIVLLNLMFGAIFPGVDNAAHIGGLISGFILSFFMDHSMVHTPSVFKKLFMQVAYPLALVLLSLSFVLQVATIVG